MKSIEEMEKELKDLMNTKEDELIELLKKYFTDDIIKEIAKNIIRKELGEELEIYDIFERNHLLEIYARNIKENFPEVIKGSNGTERILTIDGIREFLGENEEVQKKLDELENLPKYDSETDDSYIYKYVELGDIYHIYMRYMLAGEIKFDEEFISKYEKDWLYLEKKKSICEEISWEELLKLIKESLNSEKEKESTNFQEYLFQNDELVAEVLAKHSDKFKEILEDNENVKLLFEYFEKFYPECNYEGIVDVLSKCDNIRTNRELALKAIKIFGQPQMADESFLHDKEFFKEVLKTDIELSKVKLPNEFNNDKDLVESFIKHGGIFNVELESMLDEHTDSIVRNYYGTDVATLMRNDMAKIIEKTGAVVTHFGDDLDNKSAIEAIQMWAEDMDLIKIGQPLQILRVPAGQIKEGYVNLDTGGHTGSKYIDDDTLVIDGNQMKGTKSACDALQKIGIYVPQQIVDLADTKPNKVSALDSRSGLSLVRYLNGSQTFELAEDGLLDKKLSDEELEKYGLEEAHKKQQSIIDSAVEKIKKYTIQLPNGERMVLSPEQILGGSAISYEMGIKYYVSVSDHYDSQKEKDGITFAVTCMQGCKIPESVIEYAQELSKEYESTESASGIFVSPNKEMIIAGGFKNPNFKISDKNADEMLNEIRCAFTGKKHSAKEIKNSLKDVSESRISEVMSEFCNVAKGKEERIQE